MRILKIFGLAGAAGFLAIGLALAAAGPADYPGVFGQGLHGAPQAVMGCDAASPQDCVLGVDPANSAGVPLDREPTYHYSVTALTPVATPTDIVKICGSATRTVVVKRIFVSGFATTGGQLPIVLLRETTAGTLGSATLSAVTAEQHDAGQAAPTGTVNYVQTANYGTPGTTGGQVAVQRAYLNVAATGPSTPAVWDFSRNQDAPQFLRGTTDCLVVNGAGAAVPAGGKLDFEVETEEDGR